VLTFANVWLTAMQAGCPERRSQGSPRVRGDPLRGFLRDLRGARMGPRGGQEELRNPGLTLATGHGNALRAQAASRCGQRRCAAPSPPPSGYLTTPAYRTPHPPSADSVPLAVKDCQDTGAAAGA